MAKNPNPSQLDPGQIVKRAYDESNDRIRVDAQINAAIGSVTIEDSNGNELDVNPDGSLNVNLNGNVQVELSAADGDNVAISDGVNTLSINPDGSIPVTFSLSSNSENIYSEISNVASGVTSDILSMVFINNSLIKQIGTSGDNIAEYTVEINNAVKKKSRTYFGSSLNLTLTFGEGLRVFSGETLKIRVIHQRPQLGNFNTTLSYNEI